MLPYPSPRHLFGYAASTTSKSLHHEAPAGGSLPGLRGRSGPAAGEKPATPRQRAVEGPADGAWPGPEVGIGPGGGGSSQGYLREAMVGQVDGGEPAVTRAPTWGDSTRQRSRASRRYLFEDSSSHNGHPVWTETHKELAGAAPRTARCARHPRRKAGQTTGRPLTSALLTAHDGQYPADGIQSEEVACVPRTHGLVARNHHGQGGA
jgi:hypothetical protein